MDEVITQEITNYFRNAKTVYKFEGTIHELQDLIRESMPILVFDKFCFFTVIATDIPEDSRFSIFLEKSEL